MPDVYPIRIKKDYAGALIEHLIHEDAIEDINYPELSDIQKKALDIELEKISEDPSYLQDWDQAKTRI